MQRIYKYNIAKRQQVVYQMARCLFLIVGSKIFNDSRVVHTSNELSGLSDPRYARMEQVKMKVYRKDLHLHLDRY